jgi:hypothetical protein
MAPKFGCIDQVLQFGVHAVHCSKLSSTGCFLAIFELTSEQAELYDCEGKSNDNCDGANA